jgi:NADH dehydrogenase
MGFKTLTEAIALRNRLIHTFEMAEVTEDADRRRELLTYVFVGAGYAGLEGIAELQDFARDVVDAYPRLKIEDTRFVLIEARDRVMPEIGPGLAAFATKQLRRRGLDVRLETTLESVAADHVVITGGEVVPTRTVCWTAGVRPVAVVERLGLPLGAGGRIEVDETMRVPGFDDVWALGDAAAVPDPARPGQPCPPTAQHALRQGRLVGKNIAAVLDGREAKPFTFKTLGVFVDMGRYKAVAETGPLRWRGFPAWWLARTYHLLLMPGTSRRLRLVFDWTVGLLFGRDASHLGRLGHPVRLDAESGVQPGADEGVGAAGIALDDRARS